MTVRLIPQFRSLAEALDYARTLDRAGLLPAPVAGRLLVELTESFAEIDLTAAAAAQVLAPPPV